MVSGSSLEVERAEKRASPRRELHHYDDMFRDPRCWTENRAGRPDAAAAGPSTHV